jgi:hypothetical protein
MHPSPISTIASPGWTAAPTISPASSGGAEMASAKKKAAPKASAPRGAAAAASCSAAELKAFHYGGGKVADFGFSRFWWEGDGPREGIAAKVLKKFRPVSPWEDDPDVITAAKTDLLLPFDAQADYVEVEHLLDRFDAKLPGHEKHAYVQVTLHFPEAINLHAPFEEARAFAMRHLVVERRLAVVLVLHAPNLAASSSTMHAHLIAPLRRLTSLGWGEVERKLASDRGQQETRDAWLAFRAEWSKASANLSVESAYSHCRTQSSG